MEPASEWGIWINGISYWPAFAISPSERSFNWYFQQKLLVADMTCSKTVVCRIWLNKLIFKSKLAEWRRLTILPLKLIWTENMLLVPLITVLWRMRRLISSPWYTPFHIFCFSQFRFIPYGYRACQKAMDFWVLNTGVNTFTQLLSPDYVLKEHNYLR